MHAMSSRSATRLCSVRRTSENHSGDISRAKKLAKNTGMSELLYRLLTRTGI